MQLFNFTQCVGSNISRREFFLAGSAVASGAVLGLKSELVMGKSRLLPKSSSHAAANERNVLSIKGK